MKGQIVEYSAERESGVISGDDGQRYTFSGAEWKGNGFPSVGMMVDFAAINMPTYGNRATQVYLDDAYSPPQAPYAPPQEPQSAPQGNYPPPQPPHSAPQGNYPPPQPPYSAPQPPYPPPQAPAGPGNTGYGIRCMQCNSNVVPQGPVNWLLFIVFLLLCIPAACIYLIIQMNKPPSCPICGGTNFQNLAA